MGSAWRRGLRRLLWGVLGVVSGGSFVLSLRGVLGRCKASVIWYGWLVDVGFEWLG